MGFWVGFVVVSSILVNTVIVCFPHAIIFGISDKTGANEPIWLCMLRSRLLPAGECDHRVQSGQRLAGTCCALAQSCHSEHMGGGVGVFPGSSHLCPQTERKLVFNSSDILMHKFVLTGFIHHFCEIYGLFWLVLKC